MANIGGPINAYTGQLYQYLMYLVFVLTLIMQTTVLTLLGAQ